LAEVVALSKSNIPCVLDALNLMASVHNKNCVEALRTGVLELKKSQRIYLEKNVIEGK
jgi:hypothetical protein